MPPNPGAIVFPTNFPDESFWFDAGAFLPAPADGLLVLALEAAFTGATAPVFDGEQIVFGRLRYRIDVPGPGTYTVTTPYGVFTEVVPLGETVINVSRDIGIGGPGVYTGALASDIGPFLRASATPGGAPLPFFDGSALRPGALYLLNPAIATTAVTGGTTGNIFSVVGPGFNFQTDQFSLQGRVFNGNRTHFFERRPRYLQPTGRRDRIRGGFSQFGDHGRLDHPLPRGKSPPRPCSRIPAPGGSQPASP